jgi:hypothetical protein
MDHYLKLVNFEIQRFWKFLVALITLVVVAQIIGAFIDTSTFLDQAQRTMMQEKLVESQYSLNYNTYSLHQFLNSSLFLISVMFAITVLVIYVFFIWYRDWLGKSSFIYRLLMLPTERRNVYFAKLTAILLFVLCLVGVQVVLLQIVDFIIQWKIPEQLRSDLDTIVIYSHSFLTLLYPHSLLQFVLIYALGGACVAIVFTAILFERSYSLKGIFLAAIYIIVSSAVMLTPLIIYSNSTYFYTQEIILMTIVCSILMLIAAIFTANYLLKRKINV